MNRPEFEPAVTTAILANAAMFAWGLVYQAHAETADHIEHAITLLFLAELLIKVAAQRLAYFRQPWGAFDAAVIVAALLPMLPVGLALLRLARLARVAHVARHLHRFRGGACVLQCSAC